MRLRESVSNSSLMPADDSKDVPATGAGSENLDTTLTLPPPQSFIGTTLDNRYFIEKELGHGGVGAVYLARDRKLHDKPVVVKTNCPVSMSSLTECMGTPSFETSDAGGPSSDPRATANCP